MPENLPEVSNVKEFAFLLVAGIAAGIILGLFDRVVTPWLVKIGVPQV